MNIAITDIRPDYAAARRPASVARRWVVNCTTLAVVGFISTLASAAQAQTFADVPPDHFAVVYIEALAASGITSGCGNNNFCPDDQVTRAQMAVFLERALRGSAYVPPPASGTKFLDVPAGSFAAAYIEQLAADGITAGCGGGNFCPSQPVTRAQMAVFLGRLLLLPGTPGGRLTWDVGHWDDSVWN